MSQLIPFKGHHPKLGPSVFVAQGARIVGNVEIGEESSVWFNTVIRGDVNSVRIGTRTNIQDNSVLHVTHEKYPLRVGSNVTVGHSVVLHGCSVEDNCLIGMGSVILDDAKICRYSIVAAGSLVLEHFEVPEGMLAAGSPAVIKRPLTAAERDGLSRSADNYVRYAAGYRNP